MSLATCLVFIATLALGSRIVRGGLQFRGRRQFRWTVLTWSRVLEDDLAVSGWDGLLSANAQPVFFSPCDACASGSFYFRILQTPRQLSTENGVFWCGEFICHLCGAES